MEVEIIKYEFDETGLSPNNLGQDERHVVHEATKFILLRGGCYYRTSLEITNLDTGEELKETVDYRVGNLYQVATLDVGQAIYGSVFFEREIAGTLSVNVQYIGGKYSVDTVGIAELLNQVGTRGDKVLWDDIIKPDSGIKPALHPHNTMTDLMGTQEVVSALLLIADRIVESPASVTSSGLDAAQLESRLNNRVVHQNQDFTVLDTYFDSRTVVFTGHTSANIAIIPAGYNVKQGMYLFALNPGCVLKLTDAQNTQVHGATVVDGEITLDSGCVYRLDGIGNDEYLLSRHS